MASRVTYAFDGGVAGTAPAVAGDILAVQAGVTYVAPGVHGDTGLDANGSDAFVRIANSGTVTHSGSIYVSPKATGGSNRVVALTTPTNTILASIRLMTSGFIDIANTAGASQVSTGIAKWVAEKTLRIDWQWESSDITLPTLTVRVFTSHHENEIADEQISWQPTGLTVAQARWQFGAQVTAGAHVVIDTIRIYDGLEWATPFGPPPPPSTPDPGTVEHHWVGASTATGFTVASRVTGATSVRIKVATDQALTENVVFVAAQVPDVNGIVRHTATGLASKTTYYYQLEDTKVGGTATLVGPVGKARTLPAAGTPQNFAFAFGGCTNDLDEPRAFDNIRAWGPDFMLHLGDFHYQNPTDLTPAGHIQKWFDQIQNAAGLKDLLRETPVFYIRSDHDAGPGDNMDSNVASNQASIDGYQQIVPLPPLADSRSPKHGLYFAFTVGRVRFICIDVRNMDRSPGLDPQSSAKTMLGAVQKQWLKDQLMGPEVVKVLVSDVPWNGPAATDNGEDKWWAYDNERVEIGQFIVSNGLKVVMLHADAHALLADQSHNQWGGFPAYGAAPFSNVGGGRNLSWYDQIYSTETARGSQYGRVTVTDDGTDISFTFQGWDAITDTQKIAQTDDFSSAITATWWDGASETGVQASWYDATTQTEHPVSLEWRV